MLGDSYASGIGAESYRSKHPNDLACNRFTGSYGLQLAADEDFLPSFDFKPCAGAKIRDVHWQIRGLQYKLPYDFVTLSIVGNDFAFAQLINNCVYQFTNWLGLNLESRCDRTINAVFQDLAKPDIWEDYKEVLEKTMVLLHENGKVFVNGYGRLFGTPRDLDECDFMTWSSHNHGISLRAANRQKLNNIVKSMNDGIQDAIDEINRKWNTTMFEYVDVNEIFEGHRFCDHGRTRGSDDPDVWFFDFLTPFDDELEAQADVLSDEPDDTANQGQWADKYKDILDEGGLLLSRDGETAPFASPAERAVQSLDDRVAAEVDDDSPLTLAERRLSLMEPLLKYLRVFHPKPQAHTAIKERILSRAGARAHAAHALRFESAEVRSIPTRIEGSFDDLAPADALHLLRQAVCTSRACEPPIELPYTAVRTSRNAVNEVDPFVAGHTSCDIALALPSGIELFAARGPLTTSCDAVLFNMTENLVGESPFAYEWNGPIEYEWYATGFRPRKA
jgi:hypothetical protein